MSRSPTQRKCHGCNRFFFPDRRTADRQRYCSEPACRKVGKAASQQRWLSKNGNDDYRRGPDQVARVRHLNCDGLALSAARQQLMDADLVAFERPLYQVLALSEGTAPLVPQRPRTGEVRSVGEILRSVFEGAQR